MNNTNLWMWAIKIAIGIAIIIALCISVFGCAMIPGSIPIEIQHTSSISQHFGSHKTNFGLNTYYVGAKWQSGPVQFEVRDGYTPDMWNGRHEVFEASIRYEIRVRK